MGEMRVKASQSLGAPNFSAAPERERGEEKAQRPIALILGSLPPRLSARRARRLL